MTDMPADDARLPPLTLIVEWENALDTADAWIHGAFAALEEELARSRDAFAAPPVLMYLFDRRRVDEARIRDFLSRSAPRLPQLCTLRFVPTDGLRYYELKNRGAALADTELLVMLDCDTAPQPGWLRNLVAPLARDPSLMAAGGVTVLGFNNLVSRTMALCWNFRLREERAATARSRHVHANNLAVRTEFFRANLWPDLPAFRKQCTFWIRDLQRRGIGWTRAVDAVTIHAPQRDLRFLAWRGWTAGRDYDFQIAWPGETSRAGRLGKALQLWIGKSARASWRIAAKGRQVGLPAWQVPAALLVGNGYYLAHFLGQVASALTRSWAAPAPQAGGALAGATSQQQAPQR